MGVSGCLLNCLIVHFGNAFRSCPLAWCSWTLAGPDDFGNWSDQSWIISQGGHGFQRYVARALDSRSSLGQLKRRGRVRAQAPTIRGRAALPSMGRTRAGENLAVR